jgi:hypothetical protein
VLASVRFDDQLALEADEIGDERAEAMLEAELHAEAAISQPRPEEAFGIGGEAP